MASSLRTEALPTIVLYQRLYQAVHGLKGAMEITDAANSDLPMLRDCMERLRSLAERTRELPPDALKTLHALLQSAAPQWNSLQQILSQTVSAVALEPARFTALKEALSIADPHSRTDSLATARLQWAALQGFELQSHSCSAPLTELESIDSSMEMMFIEQGGLFISRSLSALSPSALTMAEYKVELRYVGAAPARAPKSKSG